MRRLTGVLPLVGAALLLSACSSSNATGSTASASAGAGAGTGNGTFTAYRQCLSEHGVTLPEGTGPGGGRGDGTRPSGMPTDMPSGMPTGRPSGAPSGFPSAGPRGNGGGMGMRVPTGVDEATWKAAQEACASLAPTRPNGGQRGTGGSGYGNGSSPSATSAASEYAVFWQCMSDHDVTAPSSGDPKDLDSSDAAVAAALKTCDALLPSGS